MAGICNAICSSASTAENTWSGWILIEAVGSDLSDACTMSQNLNFRRLIMGIIQLQVVDHSVPSDW